MIAVQDFNRENGRRKQPRGPLLWVLDFFSSVWVGIVWLSLLFIYCSVGSAVPAVRQLPGLEMTEFEWFHWWPFDVLMVLFCITLITVTIRKIKLNTVNLGVWTIHTGIIVLCIGSYVYFSSKVEGDAPVFRRAVQIEVPGAKTSGRLLALPGNETSIRVGEGTWRFAIQDTHAEWPILSEADKNEKAYSVNVFVTPPNGQPFIRQLLAGYPQYTEDIIPGKGRAVKATGKKLMDENLRLSLELEPTEYFHLQESWALFVRKAGETEWIERPINGLPRYHDRIASRDQVFSEPNEIPTIRPIDLHVPAVNEADPLAKASVHVTGFLRYADLQRRWREGGDRLNPVLRITALSEQDDAKSYELIAFDRTQSRVESGAVEFRWFDNSAMLDALPTDPRPKLSISVPSANVSIERVLTDPDAIGGTSGPFTKIEGTEFSYRIRHVQDDLFTEAGFVSVAMVEIEAPDGPFTRMAAYPHERTRDMRGEADPHSGHGREPQMPDPRIVMKYQPASALVTFAAHPGGLHLIVNGDRGRVIGKPVTVGEHVEVVPGLRIRIDAMTTNALAEVKPYIVPPAQRQREARESNAMIRLELDTGKGAESRWLHFNSHALASEQYSHMGRLPYSPEQFRLADGSTVEVLFSRERRKLPYPVALEDFELLTHVGGFTGNNLTIMNYVSQLRFLDNGRWTEPTTISVNDPKGYGGYWYFQSYWDRPMGNDTGGGMNYTGLGIGNRHGVHVQLAGCCIAAAGMIYAFYVKPVLKRRRAEQARGQSKQSEVEMSEPRSEQAELETTIA